MKLVGHRGLPALYPENTLLSLRKALEAGADAVEFDLQFSADGYAFLLHDTSFLRTGSRGLSIESLSKDQIVQLSVHEPDRFGHAFYPVVPEILFCLESLSKSFPDATYFIEVKTDVFLRYSREYVYRHCCDSISACEGKLVFISYDYAFLECVKSHANFKYGWVLEGCTTEELAKARRLAPDFLIADKHEVPDEGDLVEGPWDWFIYDIVEPDEASSWVRRGATWIESWDVTALRVMRSE